MIPQKDKKIVVANTFFMTDYFHVKVAERDGISIVQNNLMTLPRRGCMLFQEYKLYHDTCDPFGVNGVVRMVHYYKHVNPSDSAAAGLPSCYSGRLLIPKGLHVYSK
jgi:hypothetical protein